MELKARKQESIMASIFLVIYLYVGIVGLLIGGELKEGRLFGDVQQGWRKEEIVVLILLH